MDLPARAEGGAQEQDGGGVGAVAVGGAAVRAAGGVDVAPVGLRGDVGVDAEREADRAEGQRRRRTGGSRRRWSCRNRRWRGCENLPRTRPVSTPSCSGETVDLAEGGGVVEQGVEGIGGDGGARARHAHGARARAVLVEAGGGGRRGSE